MKWTWALLGTYLRSSCLAALYNEDYVCLGELWGLKETLSWSSMTLFVSSFIWRIGMILPAPQCIEHDYPYFLHSLSFITSPIVPFTSPSQPCFLLPTCSHCRGKSEGSVSWCSNHPTHCLWAGKLSFSSQGCLCNLVQSLESAECLYYILFLFWGHSGILFLFLGSIHLLLLCRPVVFFLIVPFFFSVEIRGALFPDKHSLLLCKSK